MAFAEVLDSQSGKLGRPMLPGIKVTRDEEGYVTIKFSNGVGDKFGLEARMYIAFLIEEETRRITLKAMPDASPNRSVVRQRRKKGSFSTDKKYSDAKIKAILGETSERFIPEEDIISFDKAKRTVVIAMA